MNIKDLAPYIVPMLIVALVARRVVGRSKLQRVRPNRLWIGPFYIAAAMGLTMWNSPPKAGPLGIALFAGAALIGAVVGYFRALHQAFSIDPETGEIMSKASPIGSLIFVGVFMVRFALNYWIRGGPKPDMMKPPSPEVLLYTDAMLFFALGMVTASAWEVWRRTRGLKAP